VGTLYILDEPTIGLHQHDNARLIKTLKDLRDKGNTIVVVEHDEETIFASDYLVDFGPAAGVHGGEIVARGKLPEILDDKEQDSLTLKYLRREKKIPIPERRRKIKSGTPKLKIRGASKNNLQDLDVDIPLRRFVTVTGVSGSGKSTLIHETLYKHLVNVLHHAEKKPGKFDKILGIEYIDKIINIDQSAIGRTPRSTPATYVGVWGDIRKLFAWTEEAKMRGWDKGRFSFNTDGGRCENCNGYGHISVEMHFLPTVKVTCDSCQGKRFNKETLEIKYRGKNIYEILQMTVEEAMEFFKDTPWIHRKLKILNRVGLGYLTLGQPSPTLSGGEAQRVKLASELARKDTRSTLYLLDEPTVGLHYEDVRKLIKVLQSLVDRGNSVVIIEHNLEIIKSSDYIIDLGPGGGKNGGQVVVAGPPEIVKSKAKSKTAKYLRKII
jgi:excinuclease ABC subunit A